MNPAPLTGNAAGPGEPPPRAAAPQRPPSRCEWQSGPSGPCLRNRPPAHQTAAGCRREGIGTGGCRAGLQVRHCGYTCQFPKQGAAGRHQGLQGAATEGPQQPTLQQRTPQHPFAHRNPRTDLFSVFFFNTTLNPKPRTCAGWRPVCPGCPPVLRSAGPQTAAEGWAGSGQGRPAQGD